jgi:hypothetical protein
MFRNRLLGLCLTTLMLLIANCISSHIKAYAATTIFISPSEISDLTIGDTFAINASVTDVDDLAGWEFKLYYRSQVLNATEATEGPFLSSARSTMFLTVNFTDNYNSTHGRIWLTCALLGLGAGASGSGTLATITFRITGAGYSPLSLLETKLVDATPVPPGPQPIPHTASGGSVTVIGHDIAVTAITLSKAITNDTTVTINVTVLNNGNYTATFDVTLYYDENEIQTQTVTDLAPANSLDLTYLFDTTPLPKGNYTIKAYAPPITGENYVENNLLIDGWIKETILGDVTGDGQVNILDISLVAVSFGAKPGDPMWNPMADINNDNQVNILDISTVAIHFGEVDP